MKKINISCFDPDILKKASMFLSNTSDDWNYILPSELKIDLQKRKNYFLIDTRKYEDYIKGHIKGATNIFWLDILKPENLQKLPMDKEIIICCYVGHTGSQILVILRLLGFDAKVLKYGMGKSPLTGIPIAGWETYGYKIVKTKSNLTTHNK